MKFKNKKEFEKHLSEFPQSITQIRVFGGGALKGILDIETDVLANAVDAWTSVIKWRALIRNQKSIAEYCNEYCGLCYSALRRYYGNPTNRCRVCALYTVNKKNRCYCTIDMSVLKCGGPFYGQLPDDAKREALRMYKLVYKTYLLTLKDLFAWQRDEETE